MYNKGISVVIPCYNREKTIKACIDSVISQDFSGKVEIIVSDDGSTDHSFDVIEEFGERVILIRKPQDCKDQGVSGTRNRGILASRNEYVCFLDSDDYYLAGFLKTMAKTLDTDPDLGYTFCRSKQEEYHEGSDVTLSDWTRKRLSRLDKKYHALYRSFNINTNTIFIRRSVLDQVGLFDVTLSNLEDTDMWIRLSEISKGMFVDFYGAVYRINHSSEQLTSNAQKRINDCLNGLYLKIFQRYFFSEDVDKIRLLLIVRIFLYLKMTKKMGLIYTILRFTVINIKLFCLFPKTFWSYMFKMF